MAQDYNRIMSADDILKQTIETRDERRDVPSSDILTGTLLCLKFNEDWFPHIIGAVNTLQTFAAWVGNDDDSNAGARQITKLLAQDMTDCGGTGGDCDILTLLADDEFFETEYIVQNFGDYYSETVANETAQAAIYDDTPQSIAPDAPVGMPNDIEKNALCAAIKRFVSLYASTKLCLIQSKNFVEVTWTKLAGAANEFYTVAASLMSPIYSPNIFSCFVSDAVAITALQNDAAIEELACHIYDELKTVTMSQSNFDGAILDAATTLTDDAGDIACLMQNDNNLSLYINMLEAYNVSLQQPLNDVDCPCETGAYRLWVHDFKDGFGVFTKAYSGNTALGILDGDRLRGGDIGTTRRITINWDDFDMSWRIRSVKIYYEHVGGIAHGSNDSHIVSLRPNVNSNTGSSGVISNGFAANGIGTRCWVGSGTSYLTGFRQVTIYMSVSDPSDASNIYLDRVEILFVDGYAPSGAYTDDSDLCS